MPQPRRRESTDPASTNVESVVREEEESIRRLRSWEIPSSSSSTFRETWARMRPRIDSTTEEFEERRFEEELCLFLKAGMPGSEGVGGRTAAPGVRSSRYTSMGVLACDERSEERG